jgi:exodeoxyribonuclease VII large subunit
MAPRDYQIKLRGPRRVAEEPAETNVQSVSALTRRIKDVLESSIAPGWVRGEVSNLRQQSSGHMYFSLKDADSQITCVMFRGDVARSGTATVLRDGAQVIVYAEISVYEPRGNYQLIVRAALDDGVGRLQQEFEKLKQRLAAEGLFEAERKKPLPAMPATIGFITSPTGAAVQDFMRILKRRNWSGRLVVFPAKVQGTEAAGEMMAALELAHELSDSKAGPHFDLLVIGRGGGSLEDLWAFNEEPLVRLVAASRIPIISAVGHEIDFTLCDFAADVRAETPSAAAELITSGYLDGVERLRLAMTGMDRAVGRAFDEGGSALESARRHLTAVSPSARIERGHLQVDDCSNRLASAVRFSMQTLRQRLNDDAGRLKQCSPEPLLMRMRDRVKGLAGRFERECGFTFEKKKSDFSSLEARLLAVGPGSVLRRGYVILRDERGKPVVSSGSVIPGKRLRGQFHDGEVPLRAE